MNSLSSIKASKLHTQPRTEVKISCLRTKTSCRTSQIKKILLKYLLMQENWADFPIEVLSRQRCHFSWLFFIATKICWWQCGNALVKLSFEFNESALNLGLPQRTLKTLFQSGLTLGPNQRTLNLFQSALKCRSTLLIMQTFNALFQWAAIWSIWTHTETFFSICVHLVPCNFNALWQYSFKKYVIFKIA